MPVIVGAGSSAFEASGSSIKLPTATANLSGINTAVGTAYYNTAEDELRIYTGAANGWQNAAESAALGTEGNPADSAEALRGAGITTNGLYYINTPDGGVQQVYCMFTTGSSQGGDYGWMLVCRFAEDAKTTIRNSITSVRGMNDVTQSGGSRWSADFGTYQPTEVRMIGAGDSANWMGSRNTDWILGVPSGQNLIRFMTNQTNYTNTSKTSYGTVSSGPKEGISCDSARDGRGRWTNNQFTMMRISDPATNGENWCRPGYFKTPGTDMWYYHGKNDAKFCVSATATNAGQDTDSSALIGTDDGNGPAWYDANNGNVGQNATRVDSGFDTAFFIFVR